MRISKKINKLLYQKKIIGYLAVGQTLNLIIEKVNISLTIQRDKNVQLVLTELYPCSVRYLNASTVVQIHM